jgi:hypothetical protein
MTTPTRRECYAPRPPRRELRSALDRAARAGGHHRAAKAAVEAFDAVPPRAQGVLPLSAVRSERALVRRCDEAPDLRWLEEIERRAWGFAPGVALAAVIERRRLKSSAQSSAAVGGAPGA